ncbi:MAG: HTTM domain-containing protein [Verrucomicrobia bacterium]|nr:HTTM domain-containing protein [Verrucomicrobiota bacterium]
MPSPSSLRTAGNTAGASSPERLFSIDPRSLALFRILAALVLLFDLAIRCTDLRAMYTDEGMFPRWEVCYRVSTVWNWSFHFGGGSAGYQAVLFALAGLLGVALLVGWETRLATLGSWLMLVSVQHRVPAILSGSEILLRMLLLWGVFLPLGARWSLDQWRRRRRGGASSPDAATPIRSVASAAILLQMALMYLFSALYKSNGEWFRGEAVAGSLDHEFYGSAFGRSLLSHPNVLSVLTWGTLALEWLGPLVLLFPRSSWKLRVSVLTALVVMHLGIHWALEVGTFSWVAIAGLSLFVPPQLWNRISVPDPGGVPLGGNPSWSGLPMGERIAQSVCGALLGYVILVNVGGLPSSPLSPLAPERWRPMTTGLGLSQRWAMFDTAPSRNGGYFARARLRDGTEVDLLGGGAPVDWSAPMPASRAYPNYFWRKLFREMAYADDQGFQVYRAPVAKYLCRLWNARNPPGKQVAEFEWIYGLRPSSSVRGASGQEWVRERLLHLEFDGPGITERIPGG